MPVKTEGVNSHVYISFVGHLNLTRIGYMKSCLDRKSGFKPVSVLVTSIPFFYHFDLREIFLWFPYLLISVFCQISYRIRNEKRVPFCLRVCRLGVKQNE